MSDAEPVEIRPDGTWEVEVQLDDGRGQLFRLREATFLEDDDAHQRALAKAPLDCTRHEVCYRLEIVAKRKTSDGAGWGPVTHDELMAQSGRHVTQLQRFYAQGVALKEEHGKKLWIASKTPPPPNQSDDSANAST